jgi:hypothetical protein
MSLLNKIYTRHADKKIEAKEHAASSKALTTLQNGQLRIPNDYYWYINRMGRRFPYLDGNLSQLRSNCMHRKSIPL